MNKFFAGLFFAFHVVIVLLFGLFVEYSDEVNAKTNTAANSIRTMYPMYQDVHVMIFFGFGFLMVFLRKHGFNSIGLSMLIAVFCVEWSILVHGFMRQSVEENDKTWNKIHIDVTHLLEGDFAAAAVLITFGALLGRVSSSQMLFIAALEICFFSLNEAIGLIELGVKDAGGSMFVHAFGAYFGLACALGLRSGSNKEVHDGRDQSAAVSDYKTDIMAMAGTIFLWMYWPSFNSALSADNAQHRAVVNTVMSLVSCTMTAFVACIFVYGKFNMVEVQNATLAGGVAIGTVADMQVGAWGAMIVGGAAGILSVVGYRYITPALKRNFGIDDTCGVHNLHGMPAVVSGIAGACAASVATTDRYSIQGLGLVFPKLEQVPVMTAGVVTGYTQSRTKGEQAGHQIAALFITLGIALVSGFITGKLAGLFGIIENFFTDEDEWNVPEDFGIDNTELSQAPVIVSTGADKEMVPVVSAPASAPAGESAASAERAGEGAPYGNDQEDATRVTVKADDAAPEKSA